MKCVDDFSSFEQVFKPAAGSPTSHVTISTQEMLISQSITQDLSSIRVGDSQDQNNSVSIIQQTINQIQPICCLTNPGSVNQTPQFARIPPAPKFDPARMRTFRKQETPLINFQWQPVKEVAEDSLFSNKVTTDAKFETKLKKHFSKKPKATVVIATPRTEQRQIENIFDYQRAIIIQTSMLRNNLNFAVLDSIDFG